MCKGGGPVEGRRIAHARRVDLPHKIAPHASLGGLVPKYNMPMSGSSSLLSIRSTRFVTLCGRIFHNTDPRYFPRAAYHGRTIYFCTESCLGAFHADADRFYRAHRKSNHKVEQPPK